MLKKILLFISVAIALTIIVGFILFKFFKIPEPFPKDSQSYLWAESGKYEVLTTDVTLRDVTRATQAHEYFTRFEGMPYRQFESTIWFPKSQQNERRPLIIYSHGFMSERSDTQYILQHLSSHGYIVLGANYPLTSKESGDAILMADVVNQPADISFFIDQITNPETDIGKTFSHLIDENRIGAMGYSLGGLTSTLAAYHPAHLDHRIKAVVSLAGPSAMLGGAFYQTNTVPFMMVAGAADRMTPYDDHAAVILERIKNSVLVRIDGGSHMGFAGVASFLRWTNNPDSLACSLMNMKMESMGLTRGPEEKSWYELLGTNEQGIIYDEPSIACDPNGTEHKAINPLRQQMLTKVAVISFFESVFSTPDVQEKAKVFLTERLENENKEVNVVGEYVLGCQTTNCD